MAMEKRVFSVEEAAAYLDVSRRKLFNMLKDGTGPRSFMIGRNRKFDRSDVDAWIESRKPD